MEAQGYKKLVEALRHLSTGRCEDSRKCELCAIYETCLTRCVLDAAATIEALQADVPKRGKWIKLREFVEDWQFDGFRCSICNWWKGDFETYNYCPKCGAKMEAQDG